MATKKHAPNDSISEPDYSDAGSTPAKPKAKASKASKVVDDEDEENAGPSTKPAGVKSASDMYQKVS